MSCCECMHPNYFYSGMDPSSFSPSPSPSLLPSSLQLVAVLMGQMGEGGTFQHAPLHSPPATRDNGTICNSSLEGSSNWINSTRIFIFVSCFCSMSQTNLVWSFSFAFSQTILILTMPLGHSVYTQHMYTCREGRGESVYFIAETMPSILYPQHHPCRQPLQHHIDYPLLPTIAATVEEALVYIEKVWLAR